MKKFLLLMAAVVVMAGSAWADFIPYPNSGVLNPVTYSFTAASTGNITAYFYGASAGYGSKIGLKVNGVSTGIEGLQNNTTPIGTSVMLGSVTAGDTLVFQLFVSQSSSTGPPPLSYTLSSDPSENSDGLNHVYATAFTGNALYPQIPNGTYIGFEDILGGGDKDYNDNQFIFTNVSVPDGGMTLMLLGGALVGLESLRRRYRA